MTIAKDQPALAADVLTAIATAVSATGLSAAQGGVLQIAGEVTEPGYAVPAIAAGGFLQINVDGIPLCIPVFTPGQPAPATSTPVTRTLQLQAPTGVVAGQLISIVAGWNYSVGQPGPMNALIDGNPTEFTPTLNGNTLLGSVAASSVAGDYSLQLQDAVNTAVFSNTVDLKVAATGTPITRTLSLNDPVNVVAGGVINISGSFAYSNGQPGLMTALLGGTALSFTATISGTTFTGAIEAPTTAETISLEVVDAAFTSVQSNTVEVQIAAPPNQTIAVALASTIAQTTIATITTTGGLETVYVARYNAGNAVSGFTGVQLNSAGSATYSVTWANQGDYLLVVGNTQTYAPQGKSLAYAPRATALGLFTPPSITFGQASKLTGTFSGSPLSLDYNIGAGWVTATTGLTINNQASTYSIALPQLSIAGYTAQVRDTNAPSVLSPVTGTFYVRAFNPASLVSPGAVPIWYTDPNDPTLVILNSDGSVFGLQNRFNIESITSVRATTAPPVQIPSTSGSDGKHQSLQMSPTTLASQPGGAGNYDPATNWLTAGGYTPSGGAGNPSAPTLIAALNSSNSSTTNFAVCFAIYLNAGGAYATGPVWGQLAAPGPLQYIQAGRLSSPVQNKLSAQCADTGAGYAANDTTLPASGWYVVTMVKTGTNVALRLNGSQVSSGTVSSVGSFQAVDFMLGGGFPPLTGNKPGQENGVPYPNFGAFYVATGVVLDADLASIEVLIGDSIGKQITFVSGVSRKLLLDQPSDVVSGSTLTFDGLFNYSIGAPTVLKVSISGTVSTVDPTLTGTEFAGVVNVPTTTGQYTIQVADAAYPGVVSNTLTFNVTPNTSGQSLVDFTNDFTTDFN